MRLLALREKPNLDCVNMRFLSIKSQRNNIQNEDTSMEHKRNTEQKERINYVANVIREFFNILCYQFFHHYISLSKPEI